MQTYQVFYIKDEDDPDIYSGKFKNIRAKTPFQAMFLFQEKYPHLKVLAVV